MKVANALAGASAYAADENPSNKPAGNSETNAPNFKQPRTLAELLALPPDRLEKVDVALINLLCADGLRGSEDLDIDYFTRTLEGWAAHVESETKRNFHLFQEHPEKFRNSLAYFRMAMLATVLVQDLRIRYNPEREKQLENGHILRREDEKTFFADSKDVFIHGLLTGKHYGTCASLPFLYVAVGRRLGYPVTLATTATHFYVRYEEGNGKHLNVEATEHRAFLAPSDDEYKNPWELRLSDDEVKGMVYLQPMSNKEILGHSLLTRSAVLRSMKQYDKQAETWATAARYLPETPTWKEIIHDMQIIAKNEGEQERREALWNRVAQLYVPRGAGYAYFQDKKVRLHVLMNHSADTVAVEKAIKDFEKELGEYTKPFIEDGAGQVITLQAESQPQLVLRYIAASGKQVKIPADYLPPFERRMIPPELSQRVADKRLEDEESILSEFWAFYDEQAQARHRAMQQATRQRALQTGPVLIARERVPREYWDSIPSQLQFRLSGLKDDQNIVNEMWAYRREEAAREQEEQQRARMTARGQAMRTLRQHGISPPQNFGAPKPAVPSVPQLPGAAQIPIPEMYREWITPEIAKRLSPGDIWLLQQNERNLQAMQRGKELRQQMSGTSHSVPLNFQLVPGSVLPGEPGALPPAVQKSLLTPQSPVQDNAQNTKGRP